MERQLTHPAIVAVSEKAAAMCLVPQQDHIDQLILGFFRCKAALLRAAEGYMFMPA